MCTLPIVSTIFILSSIALQYSAKAQVTSHSPTLYSLINKDDATNLYTMSIYLKTPLQPSQLHLDLGSYITFYDCSRHYKSSSYEPVIYNSSLCIDLNTRVYGNCFRKPGPGCANDTCLDYPENPVTWKSGMGSIQTDKFALPIAAKRAQLSPPSQIVLSCTEPNKYSKIYRGLAGGSVGLASLGRFNYSLSAQISRASNSPWVFALCLPSSSTKPGVALFNSAGPYDFNPGKVDVSKLLAYTPLILAPRGADTRIYYWYKSPDYYVGLTSIRVDRKPVPLNRTLLAVDENGRGGTKISTSRPYGVLQSSIYRALIEAFGSYGGLDRSSVEPVAPFGACYAADKVRVTRVGPDVPAVDLVLGEDEVIWRIYGSNSMVRIKSGGVDAWCLGFVDGGDEPRTTVVIGGNLIEDNLLQFDLEEQRLGFSSSLLLRNMTCPDLSI